ncbi:hypothetical protein KKE60_08355 [Patescibacteria group bacterium]|nr:hypothetical protein [Patescibacteria group bacterium]
MKAHTRVTKNELKSVPRPRRFTLTNFQGEKLTLEFYHNKSCFETDMIKVCVGDHCSYVLRDEIYRYLDNCYIKDKDPDLYSDEDLRGMERQNYIKPTNPKYTPINK